MRPSAARSEDRDRDGAAVRVGPTADPRAADPRVPGMSIVEDEVLRAARQISRRMPARRGARPRTRTEYAPGTHRGRGRGRMARAVSAASRSSEAPHRSVAVIRRRSASQERRLCRAGTIQRIGLGDVEQLSASSNAPARKLACAAASARSAATRPVLASARPTAPGRPRPRRARREPAPGRRTVRARPRHPRPDRPPPYRGARPVDPGPGSRPSPPRARRAHAAGRRHDAAR